jgi:hypothetical protein
MKNIKKLLFAGAASAVMLSSLAGTVFAVTPGAVVKNEHANANACWGMDRSFYADGSAFKEAGGNMDIKRSFPGDVGEQRAAWVATYCEPHGQ